MQRRLARLIAFALACSPTWSGCATQEGDPAVEHAADSAGTATGGGDGSDAGSSSSAGKAGGGAGNGGSSAGGGGSSSGGSSAAGGTTGGSAAAGTAPVAGSMTGGGGEGGDGVMAACKNATDCDDQNPCTTDNCLLGQCSYTSNSVACATDNDPCTDDVCVVGKCLHQDNKTCECKKDADCNDNEVCTDDKCDTSNKCAHTNNTAACATDNKACTIDACAAGKCTHKDDGTCGLGTPFTVDNFNSSADWMASKTTPDNRLVAVMGINANNLEGNADLWIAEADTGSIEFGLATMVGLGKVRVVIRSTAAGTGNMVFVGTWNGTAWSDKALGAYAAIPTGNYATIEVPTADFGQALDKVTKLRLRFDVTGGEKTWQIDEISVAQ